MSSWGPAAHHLRIPEHVAPGALQLAGGQGELLRVLAQHHHLNRTQKISKVRINDSVFSDDYRSNYYYQYYILLFIFIIKKV